MAAEAVEHNGRLLPFFQGNVHEGKKRRISMMLLRFEGLLPHLVRPGDGHESRPHNPRFPRQ